jgi:hypothetical protein
MSKTRAPNQTMDRMRGSAVTSLLQLNVTGALPLIGHLLRSAHMRVVAILFLLFLASCATKTDPALASLMSSVRDNMQQTIFLQNALQAFHRQQHRWPADAAEFWAAVPQDQHWLDRTKFKRLEFTPKGDGSIFVEYDLLVQQNGSGCFNLKPDDKE